MCTLLCTYSKSYSLRPCAIWYFHFYTHPRFSRKVSQFTGRPASTKARQFHMFPASPESPRVLADRPPRGPEQSSSTSFRRCRQIRRQLPSQRATAMERPGGNVSTASTTRWNKRKLGTEGEGNRYFDIFLLCRQDARTQGE